MRIADELVPWVLLAHAGSTWFMTGLIWFVQIVHYPLMARVGSSDYHVYQHDHQRLTTRVVAPVMLIELAMSTLIALAYEQIAPAHLAWSGLAILVLIWISTATLHVPCHQRLARGFDFTIHSRLVGLNWIRTIAWSVRGVLAFAML